MKTNLREFMNQVGNDGRCKYTLTNGVEVCGQHNFRSWPYVSDLIKIQTKDEKLISFEPDEVQKIEIFDIMGKVIKVYEKNNT